MFATATADPPDSQSIPPPSKTGLIVRLSARSRYAFSLSRFISTAPWSGHYDGTYVWGRGAVDCKNTLSGTLEAVTLLLEASFVPRRTVLLAYGFDEESKGWEGAGEISKYFESVYGKDGIAFIVDEGGLGIGETYGRGFAMPATGEKGYLDVK